MVRGKQRDRDDGVELGRGGKVAKIQRSQPQLAERLGLGVAWGKAGVHERAGCEHEVQDGDFVRGPDEITLVNEG